MGKLRKSIAGSSYVRANSLGTHIITMNNSFCPSARDLQSYRPTILETLLERMRYYSLDCKIGVELTNKWLPNLSGLILLLRWQCKKLVILKGLGANDLIWDDIRRIAGPDQTRHVAGARMRTASLYSSRFNARASLANLAVRATSICSIQFM